MSVLDSNYFEKYFMYCGFSKNLIESVVCQKDATGLIIGSIDIEDENVIFEGNLICPKCGAKYEIKRGILDLLTGQDKLDNILLLEIAARDKEAFNYDNKLSARYYREIPSTIKELGNLKNKKIIEYGCGTGRFTIKIKECADILATDFSRNSLLILSKKLIGVKNVGLVLANSVSLVTSENYFDLALSAQVLEHIPEERMRRLFLENIKKTLISNGVFVCSAYHYDLRRRIKQELREGYHKSNIFFHYFSKKEIKKEFSPVFHIKKIKGIDIVLPFEYRFGFSKYFKGKLSRLLEKIPFVNNLGHLVLVTAIKNK